MDGFLTGLVEEWRSHREANALHRALMRRRGVR
jgi:hypothetical protein